MSDNTVWATNAQESSIQTSNKVQEVWINNGASNNLEVDMGRVIYLEEAPPIDPYKGPYTVTPKVSEQILSTKDKKMLDDVTIEEVPVYKTRNETGGYTVYIAKEVND